MINYIFFDVGGVLSTDTESFIIEEIVNNLHLDKESIKGAFRECAKDLQRGNISEEKFWSNFMISTGLNPHVDPVIDLCNVYRRHTITIDHSMQLADRLRSKGYGTGIITNTIRSIYKYNVERGLFGDFNPVVVSCNEGLIKPEVQIYELALKRANQTPELCVFIDDKKKLLEAASDLGMETIFYVSPLELEKELNKLGLI
ncbi:MAG TPA: HAD family phosphatase [Candidatus Nanoarchaeia archaeon]|nr:HAD family phosphatase [Candidatus Nanoarchaeia archaeon]